MSAIVAAITDMLRVRGRFIYYSIRWVHRLTRLGTNYSRLNHDLMSARHQFCLIGRWQRVPVFDGGRI
ncbi:MAG: hypothetical protein CK552_04755 [Actinobacteria bacterium]|nr:MAG: hypothetical protein CK552_04755 [Actinomycetota bacterium]